MSYDITVVTSTTNSPIQVINVSGVGASDIATLQFIKTSAPTSGTYSLRSINGTLTWVSTL